MIRGIYTAVSGMITQEAKQEVITNNLANIQTPGFKSDSMAVKKFDDVLLANYDKIVDGKNVQNVIGSISLGSKIDGTYVNFGTGVYKATDSDTDFAVGGRGFFTVAKQDNTGNTKNYYTRDGHFHVDNKGFLVTDAGDNVLGYDLNTKKTGPIKVGSAEIKIDNNFNIDLDGKAAYSFDINDFNDYSKLLKSGDNLYTGNNPIKSTGVEIKQKVLESSNVDPTAEYVGMMSVLRNYEASQKVIQSIDETLNKVVNEVGTVR